MTRGQAKDPSRTAVVGPERVTPEMSLFDYLASCKPPINQKIIDIALSQMQVPHDLREDAAQEIRMVWSTLKPNTERYSPGQIASYAHVAAKQTALKVRRELGSAVRLPGSAFRRRKDGSSYVTPGVLSVPLDWADLESWFNAGDGSEATDVQPVTAPALIPNLEDICELGSDVDPDEDEDDERRSKRLDTLERNARLLSRPQYTVLSRLIAGESLDDIQLQTGYKKGVVLREVAIGASLIGPELATGLPGI